MDILTQERLLLLEAQYTILEKKVKILDIQQALTHPEVDVDPDEADEWKTLVSVLKQDIETIEAFIDNAYKGH